MNSLLSLKTLRIDCSEDHQAGRQFSLFSSNEETESPSPANIFQNPFSSFGNNEMTVTNNTPPVQRKQLRKAQSLSWEQVFNITETEEKIEELLMEPPTPGMFSSSALNPCWNKMSKPTASPPGSGSQAFNLGGVGESSLLARRRLQG